MYKDAETKKQKNREYLAKKRQDPEWVEKRRQIDLTHSARRREKREAQNAILANSAISNVCEYHLCRKPSGKNKYCSHVCATKNRVHWLRRERKIKAVNYLGGKCVRCGYKKCMGALDFHHKGNKSFGIGNSLSTCGWEKLRQELDKCELLCRNCHSELHSDEWEEKYGMVAELVIAAPC
jgi:hypothetical protein